MIDDDALTNNGIHQLFSYPFEGQRFTLQILNIFPSSEQSVRVILSDGFAWLRGEFIKSAMLSSTRCSEIQTYTVVKFMAQDIEIDQTAYSFKLHRIDEVKTTVHSMIGQPIPYQQYKLKGNLNLSTATNNITEAVPVLKLKDVKSMSKGKVSGCIIAKVVRKPDKVNKFLNIIIEDEEHQQIQCCFFGQIAQKYGVMLQVGGWYRFEDPVLQMNNRQDNMVELKINQYSNIEKVKREREKQEPSGQKPSDLKSNRGKNKKYEEIEFKEQNFEGRSIVDNLDYFTIARPIKVNSMKKGMGRSLQCVDRFGSNIEITLWEEFNDTQILINQTYLFSKLKAKIYNGQVSLTSRRFVTTVALNSVKILSKQQVKAPAPLLSETKEKKREKRLGLNEIVYSISEMLDNVTASNQKCYQLTLATLLIKFQAWGSNQFEINNELRKKMFYISCDMCSSSDFARAKVQPEFFQGKITCLNCRTEKIFIMWNIKATLVDSESEIPCKINSEIAQKLINLTPQQGILQFMKSPETLRSLVLSKLHLLKGVFKINVKINNQKKGERFFNICEYYSDGLKAYLKRSQYELKIAEQTYKTIYLEGQMEEEEEEFPVPQFLREEEPQPINRPIFEPQLNPENDY